MGCVGGYATWLGAMTMALPIWAYSAVSLAGQVVVSPVKYFKKKDRSGLKFEDPFPGLEHRTLDVNGVKLHCVTHGIGTGKKLLLFVHGFPELWYSWRHQMRAFMGGYEIAAIDMRGYGDSERPKGRRAYWMDRLVGDVTGVVAALGHQSCVLVAHDWGAGVAWNVAANHPGVVERLVVLCAPHPSAMADPARCNVAQLKKSWYFMLFQARGLPEAVLSHSDFKTIDAIFRSKQSGARTPGAITDEDVERYKQSLGRARGLTSGVNYYRASCDNATRHPVPQVKTTLATKLQMPVLLMYADSDMAFCTHVFQGHESHVADLTLVKLENCSHWAQQDRPDVVNSHMRAFLAPGAAAAKLAAASNRGSIAVVRSKTPTSAAAAATPTAGAPASPRISTQYQPATVAAA